MSEVEQNADMLYEWRTIKQKLRNPAERLTASQQHRLAYLMDLAEGKLYPSNKQVNQYRGDYLKMICTDSSCANAIKESAETLANFEKKFVEPIKKIEKTYSNY
ncbi:MAG: hypothetical protein GVY20_02055 [Bacteroidetes bacterium]|nr:hypothetical protein [Bacteroidota bacterium]